MRSKVTLNGREISFRAGSTRSINNTLYVPLREIAGKLGLNVYWDPDTGLVCVFNSENILQFNIDNREAYFNGVTRQMPQSFLHNSKTYISIIYLADAFGFHTISDNYGLKINVYSTNAYAVKQAMNQFGSYEKRTVGKYTSDDIFWMARIVHAEAQGESYAAKLAVANVIINRKQYSSYPNTFKEVIFDKKSGIQFTPTSNGSIYCKPSADSIRAAIDSLNGKNNAKDALFFINPDYATNSWVSDNRKLAFKLENHSFYY